MHFLLHFLWTLCPCPKISFYVFVKQSKLACSPSREMTQQQVKIYFLYFPFIISYRFSRSQLLQQKRENSKVSRKKHKKKPQRNTWKSHSFCGFFKSRFSSQLFSVPSSILAAKKEPRGTDCWLLLKNWTFRMWVTRAIF